MPYLDHLSPPSNWRAVLGLRTCSLREHGSGENQLPAVNKLENQNFLPLLRPLSPLRPSGLVPVWFLWASNIWFMDFIYYVPSLFVLNISMRPERSGSPVIHVICMLRHVMPLSQFGPCMGTHRTRRLLPSNMRNTMFPEPGNGQNLGMVKTRRLPHSAGLNHTNESIIQSARKSELQDEDGRRNPGHSAPRVWQGGIRQ